MKEKRVTLHTPYVFSEERNRSFMGKEMSLITLILVSSLLENSNAHFSENYLY